MAHENDIVAKVVPPRSEKELEDLEQKAEADVAAVKVVGEEEKKAEEAQKGEELKPKAEEKK